MDGCPVLAIVAVEAPWVSVLPTGGSVPHQRLQTVLRYLYGHPKKIAKNAIFSYLSLFLAILCNHFVRKLCVDEHAQLKSSQRSLRFRDEAA